MKKKLGFTLFIGAVIISCFAIGFSFAQEQGEEEEGPKQPPQQLTITTYYPGAYAVYKELRLFPSLEPGVCDETMEGTFYFNQDSQIISVCRETRVGQYAWHNLESRGGKAILNLPTDQYDINQYPFGSGFVPIPNPEPYCADIEIGPYNDASCPGWMKIFNLWFEGYQAPARTSPAYFANLSALGYQPYFRADNASCRVMQIEANVAALSTVDDTAVHDMRNNYTYGCYPCRYLEDGSLEPGTACVPCDCDACPWCGTKDVSGNRLYPCRGQFVFSVMCNDSRLNPNDLPAACPDGWLEADCRKADSTFAENTWPLRPEVEARGVGNFVRTCYKCEN